MNILIDNVIYEMDQRKWSQSELAKRSDYHPVQICDLLSGKTKFHIGHIIKISSAFNIKPYELFLAGEQKERLKQMEELKEFLELMQVPTINKIITGKMEELKIQLKDEIEAFKKKEDSMLSLNSQS